MSISALRIKADVDRIRGKIGREVVFHVSSRVECPRCVASGYFDNSTNTSYDTTCPVCVGAYYTNITTETPVQARIRWTNDEAVTATPVGKYYAGDASIHIEPKYLELAEAAQSKGKVVVDRHDMDIKKIIPVGTMSTNRLRIVLTNSGKRPEDE